MQISQAEQKRLNNGLHAAQAFGKQVITANLVLPGPQLEPASYRSAFFIASTAITGVCHGVQKVLSQFTQVLLYVALRKKQAAHQRTASC